ncbi:MAG: hypothetical protein H0U23_07340 [Blastocatellia bacterium]|nr:hypothetical protein [Blastocatellia bacterium]
MFGSQAINRVVVGYLVAGGVFLVLHSFLTTSDLIVLINGLLIGALFAIVVAFHRLIIGAIRGTGEYNHVRQMTLGFFNGWLGIFLVVYPSIELRSMGLAVPNTLISTLGKFVIIAAAIMQVTAPDYGLGMFHGRDRKTLWSALLFGVSVSFVVVYLQKTAFFAN